MCEKKSAFFKVITCSYNKQPLKDHTTTLTNYFVLKVFSKVSVKRSLFWIHTLWIIIHCRNEWWVFSFEHELHAIYCYLFQNVKKNCSLVFTHYVLDLKMCFLLAGVIFHRVNNLYNVVGMFVKETRKGSCNPLQNTIWRPCVLLQSFIT